MYILKRYVRLGTGWTCFVPLVCCVAGIISITLSSGSRGGDPAGLFEAAKRGDDAAVAALLARGVPVDVVESGSDCTPLMYAARFGRLEVAKRLLTGGADVKAMSRGFGSPLANAATLGGADMVRLLLEQGAESNLCDPDGHSPLMHAAAWGNLDSAELLLGAGADVNAKDCRGNTPVLAAAAQGHEAVVRRLIVAGADVDARGEDGMNASMLLAEHEERDALRARFAGARDRQDQE